MVHRRGLSTAIGILALGALDGCTTDSLSQSLPGADAASDAGQSSGGVTTGSGGRASNGGAMAGSGGAQTGNGGASPSGGNGGGGASPGAGGRASTGGASSTGGSTSSPDAGRTTPRTEACPPGPTYGSPFTANRNAAPLVSGFGFIEGAVWSAQTGRLLFSDIDFGGSDVTGPPSVIRYVDVAGGGTSASLLASSGSNGLALANDGRILAATHDTQSLSYFDPRTGARTDWPLLYQGNHFNSPNDLVVRADGNVYFTDPNWQLGSRTSETQMEGFYRVSPSGDVTLVDGGLTKPNGVTLSLDERTLYVGGQSGGIQKFTLDASGVPGQKALFAPGSTDGMTLDCAGNVYATSGDVVVFGPGGNELGRITLGGSPSNVAFGGADRKTLFITAGSSLFHVDMNVPGMPY